MPFDFNYWVNMTPMKYFDNPDPKTDLLKQKRSDMLNNKDNKYIATQKWDGEWGMFIKQDNDHILIKSRGISKVTGTYGNKTASLPHLVEEMRGWPNGTVVLAEICWPQLGKVSTDVGTILRSLPERAIAKQKSDGYLIAKVFDILCLCETNLINEPYIDRLTTAANMFNGHGYFTMTDIFTDSFAEAADDIISRKGEGIVIQLRDYIYDPGKRSAWKTLKVKQKLPLMELQVVDTIDAQMIYKGDNIDSWPYWYVEASEDDETSELVNLSDDKDAKSRHSEHSVWYPVTKPYFFGWKMGVQCDYNGTIINASSGLDDFNREWLTTPEAKQMIDNGQLYAIVKSMSESASGALRHPVVKGLRLMDQAMLNKEED